MHLRYALSVRRFVVLASAFAFLGGCRTPCGQDRSPPDSTANIRWTPAVNGLSLGIEVPSAPFVFEPVPGWTGPLIIEDKYPSGELRSLRSNAGGHWHESAKLKVYLRNTSKRAIYWSNDYDVWHVSFSGAAAARPIPWPGPRPAPLRSGPVRLDPGDTSTKELRISEAGEIWPRVPPGEYTVKVSYSPDDLLTFAVGGEGNYTCPYDVPGFWKGTIATPAIVINVQYPTTQPGGSSQP